MTRLPASSTGRGSPHAAGPFAHDHYLLRQQVFKIFGDAFRIYDDQGNLVFYSRLKAFKLKEDIGLFTDEAMTHQVLRIQARNVIDFSASYDVTDPVTGQALGALRRKGLKSMFRDEWVILDADGQEIGLIQEDGSVVAMLRRFVDFVSLLIPQAFLGSVHGQPVLIFKQNFNPFVRKLSLDFSADVQGLLDRRLGIAAAILLAAVEGRQN